MPRPAPLAAIQSRWGFFEVENLENPHFVLFSAYGPTQPEPRDDGTDQTVSKPQVTGRSKHMIGSATTEHVQKHHKHPVSTLVTPHNWSRQLIMSAVYKLKDRPRKKNYAETGEFQEYLPPPTSREHSQEVSLVYTT